MAAITLFALGLYSVLAVPHLVRKVLALNIMSMGVFMFLLVIGHPARAADGLQQLDPVPQALVLTGSVVAISATALALALICEYHDATGRTALPEDQIEEETRDT